MSPSEILRIHFGYSSFRPLQKEIVEHILSGKDALVLMPTGGGKSLCYQVPAMMMGGITLVISPLISLMKDQVDALLSLGIEAAFMNSSLDPREESEIADQCRDGKIKILYLSPERALSLLHTFLAQLKIKLIAIDEAHCVSQWGHDFRPEYKQLHQLREKHPEAVMMALTATADKLTRKDILENLGLRSPESFISSFDRPNLSLNVRFENRKKFRNREIIQFINKRTRQPGIIYCLSRKSTEALAGELKTAGIKAESYHAGMESSHRTRVQDSFLKDEIQVVCATIAFGMGIDKSNVRWIIHNNLPKSIENYYQEIGRSGRDGLPADTVLYYQIGDIIQLSLFARNSGQPEINLEKLKRLQEYAESKICRRKILLNYFGENLRDNCGNCDVCKNPPEKFDGKVIAQMALSALLRIERAGGRSGTGMLINVLRGSRNAEIKDNKFDQIKTFGAGAAHSFHDWSNYLLQLIQVGAIEIAYDDGNTLRISPFGKMIIEDKINIDLIKPSLWKDEANEIVSESVPGPGSRESLFEKLRKLRLEVAREKNLPPYIIFNDFSLKKMTERIPVTEQDMLRISGVTKTKFDDFGYLFLEKLQSEEGMEPLRKLNLEEYLTEQKMKEYAAELTSKGINPSHGTVAKILLGSEMKSLEKAKNISFYGVLNGYAKYATLAPRLKEYYKPIQDQRKENLGSVSDEYFKEPLFNNLKETSANTIVTFIKNFPLEKTGDRLTDFIKEQRKTYPRASEPWSEQEKIFFREAVHATNDLGFLCKTFQRSPNAVKAMAAIILENAKTA